MIKEALQENIRVRRAKLNLTQKEAGSKVGIAGSVWSDIENGNQSPTVKTLERIALALNTTVPELFYMEEKVA